MKITAVIPCYNSGKLAISLAKQLLKAGIGRVVICDDASSDDSQNLLASFRHPSVVVELGTKNLGPAGNRNRALTHIGDADIVWCVDSDMKLAKLKGVPEIITSAFDDPSVGVVGFQMKGLDGRHMWWNFGELMHPVHEAAEGAIYELFNAGKITPKQFVKYAPGLARSLGYITVRQPLVVGWVAEGCVAIRGKLWRELNGFEPKMRYHEAHDLGVRVAARGFTVKFVPTVLTRHLEIDSRMAQRAEDAESARKRYYQKHWDMSSRTYEKLFDNE